MWLVGYVYDYTTSSVTSLITATEGDRLHSRRTIRHVYQRKYHFSAAKSFSSGNCNPEAEDHLETTFEIAIRLPSRLSVLSLKYAPDVIGPNWPMARGLLFAFLFARRRLESEDAQLRINVSGVMEWVARPNQRQTSDSNTSCFHLVLTNRGSNAAVALPWQVPSRGFPSAKAQSGSVGEAPPAYLVWR